MISRYRHQGFSTHIDDVYRPSTGSNIQNLFDISRVEVIKGPQGTLAADSLDGDAFIIALAEIDTFDGGANHDKVVQWSIARPEMPRVSYPQHPQHPQNTPKCGSAGVTAQEYGQAPDEPLLRKVEL